MQLHERELLISRILSGKLFYKNLKIIQPSIDLQYKANIVFSEAIEEGKEKGLFSKDIVEHIIVHINESIHRLRGRHQSGKGDGDVYCQQFQRELHVGG